MSVPQRRARIRDDALREERGAAAHESPLSSAEAAVSDAVGRLMEFWGFKRNMGRVWTLLYLSPTPLTAGELKDRLQISSGAVSMTLGELMRWGVVKKVWVQGDRRDFFSAEVALWRMISRVLAERERTEIAVAVESFERALEELEAARKAHHGKARADRGAEHEADRGALPLAARPTDARVEKQGEARARADFQARRVRALLDLAKLGRTLLDALLSTAKLDAEPLARFLLGGGREAGTKEP